MKHQHLHDIFTLEVEASDERSNILDWLFYNVGQYDQQPLIIVLPSDAVFRRPGDLRELQQVTASQNVPLLLVIEGNERLRLWARRHGFTVYSTLETYQKALARPGEFQPLQSGWQTKSEAWTPREQSPVGSFAASWDTYSYTTENTLGETYRSHVTGVAIDNLRTPSGIMQQSAPKGKASSAVFERPAASFDLSFYRVSEPLMELSMHRVSGDGLRALDRRASYALIEEYDAPFSSNLEFSLAEQETLNKLEPVAEGAPNVQVISRPSPWLTIAEQVRQDKLLLLLLTLIVVCIAGGVGFGYLLEMMRASSAPAPVSLIHSMFWGIE